MNLFGFCNVKRHMAPLKQYISTEIGTFSYWQYAFELKYHHQRSGAQSHFLSKTIQAILITALVLLSPISTAATSPLPEPVDSALSAAEERGAVRISFTMRFIWERADGNTVIITEHYDAATREWEIISGDPMLLSRRGRERYKTYKRLESQPGGLLYGDYRNELKDVALINESETDLTYSFSSPRLPGNSNVPTDSVETNLVIDRKEGWMRRYSIISHKPFKMNLLTNVDDFTFEQTFDKPFKDGPALMTRFYCRFKGRSTFRNFDEKFSIQFSNFEIII